MRILAIKSTWSCFADVSWKGDWQKGTGWKGSAWGRRDNLCGHIVRGFFGFTDLSNFQPATEVLKVLSDFYEIINTFIVASYCEILRFMGDGALVIFPVVDDLTAQEAAARNA